MELYIPYYIMILPSDSSDTPLLLITQAMSKHFYLIVLWCFSVVLCDAGQHGEWVLAHLQFLQVRYGVQLRSNALNDTGVKHHYYFCFRKKSKPSHHSDNNRISSFSLWKCVQIVVFVILLTGLGILTWVTIKLCKQVNDISQANLGKIIEKREFSRII